MIERNWLVVENASIHVSTGLVFDARGVPVRLTRWLRTGPDDKLREMRFPVAEPFGRPLLVGYNASYRNYYHWLIQCVFPAWLRERSSVHNDALFLTPPLNSMHRQSWPFSRIAESSHYEAPADTMLSVPRAIIIPDAFQPGARNPSPLLSYFGQEIAEQTPCANKAGPDAIYISRRDSIRRPVSNESEVERALAELGFSVITLSELAFQEQVRLFRNARLVVAPHGAGLANVIFCPPGARVIELMPSVRDNRCFERLSAVCGLRHEVKLILASSENTSMEWRVDTHRLVDTIGRAAAALD